MTPSSRVQMRIKLTNASSRVTTDLHSKGGYTITLVRIESVCMFKLGVNCLINVKHLVDKTIKFVQAFLENFETAKEVLRDST